MGNYERKYRKLNPAQQRAVDTIDGPLLVVAGPGTGKTQLLSMRVANIIRQTDTAPSNILCLTFTDNAARNMRERLETIMGQSAYHVAIHTFHSFGSEVINQQSDYFLDRQLLRQVDELGSYELLRDIFDQLPHSNPLSVKVGEEFVLLKDVLSVISWLKQNALSPDELHKIIVANKTFIDKLAEPLAKTFEQTPSPKILTNYNHLLKLIKSNSSSNRIYGFPDYGLEAAAELSTAIEATSSGARFAPAITAWRSKWCAKNAEGQQVFKDGGKNIRKMHALATVYEKLLGAMSKQGLYDFDDMIVETVHALEKYPELKYSLQERYQYILVDEFQDTNKAQLRILEALGDNPIFEDKPNIMAVGDDDQAIYSFQGAEVSNMVAFDNMYKPKIITLTENYRSTPEILKSSFAVADQISDRLTDALAGVNKQLKSKNEYKNSKLEHPVFSSELSQYDWVAKQIESLIKKGDRPETIAVLAPRHRYLERLMPYLGVRNLPVAYERRENILEAPIVKQLMAMSKLIVAIANNDQQDVDALSSEVLSFEFWEISSKDIIDLSLTCYIQHKHWLPVMMKHKDKTIREIAGWISLLARRSTTLPLEYVLDELICVSPDGIDSEYDELADKPTKKPKFISPMRNYYFNDEQYEHKTDSYLSLLGQLSSLRQRLREWKPNQTLLIKDLVLFAKLHDQAQIKIVDTNPHTQTTNAVQVMTAYKAKGLEFDTVFIINAQDEIWGPTARSRSLKIALPKNLPVAPASDGDNDKLRLLFVAMSRAKHTLIITSYSHDLSNRLSPTLSYISDDKMLKPKPIDKPLDSTTVEILSTDWAYRYRQVIADKPTLFEPILAKYKLSVTHLNNFIDVKNGGPQFFLTHNLLRFPAALSPSAAYGYSVHKTLQWISNEFKQKGKLPTTRTIQSYFSDMLDKMHLKRTDYNKLNSRGRQALDKYLQVRSSLINTQDLIERGFNNEGAIVKGAILSGKIDKMHFTGSGQVDVIDFKTGKPANNWIGKDEYEKIKLHKYRQQLLFYKLLVENSASFSKKVIVNSGSLEFIEANDSNMLVDNLELDYAQSELDKFAKLIGVIWQHIMTLNFPNTKNYKPTLAGVLSFEEDLLNGKV